MSDTGTTRIEPAPTCPNCTKVRNGATAVNGVSRPSPGDVTVCFDCRALLCFTDGLGLRWLTDGEWMALPIETRRLLTRMRSELPVTADWFVDAVAKGH